MSKGQAEDNNVSVIRQTVGGSIYGGTGNQINGVYYGSDNAAKRWLASQASKLPPKLHDESMFEPRLRDKVYKLEAFQNCLSNTGSTFVMQGRPGIGKTMIIQGLIKKLVDDADTDSDPRFMNWLSRVRSEADKGHDGSQSPGSEQGPGCATTKLVTAALYFSTKRVAISEHAPTKLLLYLLEAICKQIPNSAGAIEELYKLTPPNGMPTSTHIRRSLRTVLERAKHTCIFIDAIEECADTHLEEVLSQLKLLQQETGIGIVLTAVLDVKRKYLEEHFTKVKFHPVSAEPEDVKAYIRKRLWYNRDENSLELLASGISKEANGIFLLARLYCTRLKSFDRDEDAHEELRKIRVSRRTTDRRTEDDIKEAFWGVVDRIFHMERTGEDKRIAELAMGFVRDAQRPLSIDELLWLLSTDDDMPYPSTHRLHKWNYVRSCCHGLIEDDDFRTVVFIHRTMLDCLEDPQYASKIRVQHGEFAKRCLYQLTHAELNKSVCLDSKALDDRLVKFPLFDYAARYWHYHVARSSKTRTVPGTRVSIPGSLLHVLRQFLDDDLRVEAAFQVTLFPTRDFQSYLDRAIEEIPLTEASIRSMKAEEKVLFDPFQRNKMTGLHVACQYGFEEIASKYITKRKRYAQSLDGINIHKCTPLHYAVEGQHFQIAKALLDAGANMNCYDIFGGTPLIDSLYHSDTSMAKLLLRGKRTTLDVNAQTAPVTEFKPHEFKLLYRKGPPDLRESVIVRHRVSGRTALHYAARNNMEEITQLLLATRKVDCSLQDTQGQLAWHKAAKYGHVNILSMLLGHGMDPSSRAGQTPEGKEPDPEIKNYEGYLNTALHIAAKSNSPEVVNYLLDKFPYLAPLQNGHGETALSLAVGMQEADMVGLLLEKPLPDGIEVGINIENEAKRRPIHVSVFDKSGTCMRLLLGCEDIEVDIKDSDGNSPLDLAAKHGYPCHIEQLLELDIYFERGCEQWRRALRCAYKEDNMRTYRALFSSKKIHGMLDAEYAELRDMVLSVPPTVPLSKDILDAMTKMHATEVGESSVSDDQKPRRITLPIDQH